ncbi:MAG: hypothetical protein AAFN79_07815 [Pseudomonadota bacterium]
MRKGTWIVAASLPFCAAAAFAAADDVVSFDEWMSLTEGRIVHYAIDGKNAGKEYYHIGGGFSVFVAPDGSCVEGPWAHTDGRFCFWYGADFQCFYHKRRNGSLISQPDTGGQVQVITEITDGEPLFCAPG